MKEFVIVCSVVSALICGISQYNSTKVHCPVCNGTMVESAQIDKTVPMIYFCPRDNAAIER